MRLPLAFMVAAALFVSPLVARAEDDAGDASAADGAAADPDASGSSSSSSSSSTSSSGATGDDAPLPDLDGGAVVPGAGQTEPAEDEGCSTAPTSRFAPTGLVLALTTLWLLRRKRR